VAPGAKTLPEGVGAHIGKPCLVMSSMRWAGSI
jgi:hypothetical protein